MIRMKLFTKEIKEQLIKNGITNAKLVEKGKCEFDFKPVVKLFIPVAPDSNATWLLTELIPENNSEPQIAFGLCDLGFGEPEMGYVSIKELKELRGPFGLYVERDVYFEAKYPISVYSHVALINRRITEEKAKLEEAHRILSGNHK